MANSARMMQGRLERHRGLCETSTCLPVFQGGKRKPDFLLAPIYRVARGFWVGVKIWEIPGHALLVGKPPHAKADMWDNDLKAQEKAF